MFVSQILFDFFYYGLEVPPSPKGPRVLLVYCCALESMIPYHIKVICCRPLYHDLLWYHHRLKRSIIKLFMDYSQWFTLEFHYSINSCSWSFIFNDEEKEYNFIGFPEVLRPKETYKFTSLHVYLRFGFTAKTTLLISAFLHFGKLREIDDFQPRKQI